MTPTATLLILLSAFFHAGWNLLGKRNDPSISFFAVAATVSALTLLPLLVRFRALLPAIPAPFWLLLLLTAGSQALYMIGLATGYQRGEMSLVYPLARALPVLLIAAISLALGRGAGIGQVGLGGMVLVAAGCLVLPQRSFHDLSPGHYRHSWVLMAGVAALGTTGYTLVDDSALRLLRALPTLETGEATLLFLILQGAATAIALLLTTLLIPAERGRLRRMAAARRPLAVAGGTGMVMMTTYGLVLLSMAFVTDVSYVAAFRQFSIPLGAWFGILLLNEPPLPPKLAGTAIVLVGLVMVAVG